MLLDEADCLPLARPQVLAARCLQQLATSR
jgi:hypothetical protein